MRIDLNNLNLSTGEVNVVQSQPEGHPGYEKLIQQFLYEHVQYTADQSVRFEAISAAVFGTKQRRYGPLPSPEVQTAVRQILRESGDHLTFFLPWAGRKQDTSNLDILEFMALKQLACLQEDLLRYGVNSEFRVRIEDMTDFWLFNDEPSSNEHVATYAHSLSKLGEAIFKVKTWVPMLESQFTTKGTFFEEARKAEELFHNYFTLNRPQDLQALLDLGWQSPVGTDQQLYYIKQYRSFYPGQDPYRKLANYFASVLARTRTHTKLLPTVPFIFLTFAHPVPGNPAVPNRLYYRTLPERFTNNHRSPWLAKGYVEIDEQNNVCPKSLGYEQIAEYQDRLIPATVDINGTPVDVPYILV